IETALGALERVGDEASLERIRTFLGAARRAGSRREKPSQNVYLAQWIESLPRLAETAKRTASALEARIENERQQALLLRPAEPVHETLLRPAIAQTSEPAEQLLRPSDGPT